MRARHRLPLPSLPYSLTESRAYLYTQWMRVCIIDCVCKWLYVFARVVLLHKNRSGRCCPMVLCLLFFHSFRMVFAVRAKIKRPTTIHSMRAPHKTFIRIAESSHNTHTHTNTLSFTWREDIARARENSTVNSRSSSSSSKRNSILIYNLPGFSYCTSIQRKISIKCDVRCLEPVRTTLYVFEWRRR